MGVAGEDRLAFAVGEGDEGVDRLLQLAAAGVDRPHRPEAKVRRDLVVAASAGVQALAEIAEPRDQFPLDEGVDVLVAGRPQPRRIRGDRLADRLDRLLQREAVGVPEDPGPLEGPGPCRGGVEILREQAAVDRKRVVEEREELVHAPVEAARPERGRSGRQRGLAVGSGHRGASAVGAAAASRRASMRLGRVNSRMKPPASDCR
jgi:hypothetical protein